MIPHSERWLWVAAVCAAGLLGMMLMALADKPGTIKGANPEQEVVASWATRVEALEARVEAQAKIRCLNVTTDRMDLAIFPVDNLGKAKVTKP